MSPQVAHAGLEIALVVRDEVRRYGIEGIARSLGTATATHRFDTAEQAFTAAERRDFDVLLIGYADLAASIAPTPPDGFHAGNAPVLVLVDDEDPVPPAWVTEVQGFLAWSELGPQPLKAAVTDAVAGRFHVSPALARRLLSATHARPVEPVRADAPVLTARELQVLRLVAEGLSNKQVARALQLSENGVKRVVGNVLAKLNSPNRTLAVVRAVEVGLLTL
ncbi:response regulator transcription factor [Actinomadura macrotermitis]|uniref:HTH luxR-type domain-containing protein n=1 Tax=Actinomadura macrotermitis TaxID=2585200 RepID=A0A7K0BV46_9ACTN|nr:response regulator transcription factor [Actinomadura macrotermitis]MQY05058.1 hypothetical protein [Actinomadura macrotermitis]